jgi:hypothetical protein
MSVLWQVDLNQSLEGRLIHRVDNHGLFEGALDGPLLTRLLYDLGDQAAAIIVLIQDEEGDAKPSVTGAYQTRWKRVRMALDMQFDLGTDLGEKLGVDAGASKRYVLHAA